MEWMVCESRWKGRLKLRTKVKELVSKMTIEEKASMVSGADFWHTGRKCRCSIRTRGKYQKVAPLWTKF